MSRRRSALVWGLVVLASILALASSLTVWSKQQLLNTDQWTSSSSKLLADDEVRALLSAKLVDVLFQQVDVEQQLRERLPEDNQNAAPLIAGAIRATAPRVIDSFLATPVAQRVWQEANRVAHQDLVKVLEGEDIRRLSTANGAIVLDLSPMVERIATRLGLEDRLDPTAGQIVLLESDELETAQNGVKILNFLSVFLILVVLGLYGLAIYLAHGQRRQVLERIGTSLVIVGLTVLVARRLIGQELVDALVEVEANKPAVEAVWIVETDLLRDLGIVTVLYGLLALFAGFLGGGSYAATTIRKTLSAPLARRPFLLHTSAAVLFLLVLAWGPFANSRRLLGVIVLATLLVLGLEIWRRQIAREFPDAGAAVVAEKPGAAPTT